MHVISGACVAIIGGTANRNKYVSAPALVHLSRLCRNEARGERTVAQFPWPMGDRRANLAIAVTLPKVR